MLSMHRLYVETHQPLSSPPRAWKPRSCLTLAEKEMPPRKKPPGSQWLKKNKTIYCFLGVRAWLSPPGSCILDTGWSSKALPETAQLCPTRFLISQRASSRLLSRRWQGSKRTLFPTTAGTTLPTAPLIKVSGMAKSTATVGRCYKLQDTSVDAGR